MARLEANVGLISDPEVLYILKERSAGETLSSKALQVEKQVSIKGRMSSWSCTLCWYSNSICCSGIHLSESAVHQNTHQAADTRFCRSNTGDCQIVFDPQRKCQPLCSIWMQVVVAANAGIQAKQDRSSAVAELGTHVVGGNLPGDFACSVTSRAIDFLNAADLSSPEVLCRLSKSVKRACKKVTLNTFWLWCNST